MAYKNDYTPLKVSDLRAFGCATIDTGALQTGGPAVFSSHLLHLLSQLTGRRQHQALRKDVGSYSCIH